MDPREIGKLLAETARANAEAQRANKKLEKLESDYVQIQGTVSDIRIQLRELDTIKRVGWGLISLLAGVFGFLVYTTITNNAQIENIQQEIQGHVSAAGHPRSMETVNDVKSELGAINAALQEWRRQKDKEIEELQERLPRSRRRYR